MANEMSIQDMVTALRNAGYQVSPPPAIRPVGTCWSHRSMGYHYLLDSCQNPDFADQSTTERFNELNPTE